jgi:peptidoglycan hydrolase-like protein with peptidoglycan-binding domain
MLDIWRAGSAALAIWLFTVGAAAAQNAPEPTSLPATEAPANSPEQIRKAQVELLRLECLKSRPDGKLGEKTRAALRKYRASAKQPPDAEVKITDELIAELAGRGDLYCRPPRPFFGFGGARPGMPFMAPGARPGGLPPALKPPAPNEQH